MPWSFPQKLEGLFVGMSLSGTAFAGDGFPKRLLIKPESYPFNSP